MTLFTTNQPNNKRDKPSGRVNPARWWAIALWLLVWQLGSMAMGQEILLVSPVSVIRRLAQLAVTLVFWQSIGLSFARICGGFVLALTVGTVFASLASKVRWVRELLAPLMLTIKSVPVASFIILVLIWFSTKSLSILISFLMVLPIIYTNVLSGIESSDKQLLEMAEVFSLPTGRKIRYVLVPQVMPYLRAACTVALGLCWKAGVAAEVIGIPKNSIGEHLYNAKIYLDTPDLFAWTLVIVLISLIFERLFIFGLDQVKIRLEKI